MPRMMILFAILFNILFSPLSEAHDDFEPWDFTVQERESGSPEKELSISAVFLRSGVAFFSKYISPVDGDRCPMYPTSAAYSREAIEKHGFILGTLLTVDRLIHEANEMDRAPLVKVYGRLRYFDPVSNNDFWWQ